MSTCVPARTHRSMAHRWAELLRSFRNATLCFIIYQATLDTVQAALLGPASACVRASGGVQHFLGRRPPRDNIKRWGQAAPMYAIRQCFVQRKVSMACESDAKFCSVGISRLVSRAFSRRLHNLLACRAVWWDKRAARARAQQSLPTPASYFGRRDSTCSIHSPRSP